MNHRSVGKARAWVAGIVVVVMVGAAAAGVAAQQASPTRQGDRPSLAGRWFGVGPRAMAVGLALRARFGFVTYATYDLTSHATARD